jgi:acetyl esterase/lipase
MRSPEIRAAYNIDPNRIILVGSSAGAIGILMADMSSEIAGDFVNQSGFKNVYDNTANHPLPSDANYIPSWVCFAISEAGSVTGGYMTNWLDVAHDAPAIDIHSVDDTTILYSEAVNTMQNFSTKGILPILTTSNIIDAFTSANLALPIAPANLIIITDPDGTKLTHGEYFKADDKVQSVLFPILYTNVITAPCPTGQMTVPAII